MKITKQANKGKEKREAPSPRCSTVSSTTGYYPQKELHEVMRQQEEAERLEPDDLELQ